MKKFFAACLCVQFVLSGFAANSFGAEAYTGASGIAAAVSDEVVSGGSVILSTEEHVPYAKTDEYNCFRPREKASRAETAGMFYELLTDKAAEIKEFDDVDGESEFYNSIGVVCSKGIMTGSDDGLFHPDDGITRGEFAAVICNIFGLEKKESGFADIYDGYWADGFIGAAVDAGFMSGYDNGLFMPKKEITRAEAVCAINRALGRKADEAAAEFDDVLVMPDVEKNDWAYGDIVEATTSHTYKNDGEKEVWLTHEAKKLDLGYGFLNVGDYLFYVNGDTKQYIFGRRLGNFTFDENGRYTTGSEELDGYLTSIVPKITNSSMTKEEKLYACYLYMKDNFKYQKGTIYQNGSSGWETAEAIKIFSRGKGNCYSYAAGFTYLARQVGYDAVSVAGQVPMAGGGLTAHGWTEIVIDGTAYVFDPELAMANGYNIFKKTYDEAPFRYYKQ